MSRAALDMVWKIGQDRQVSSGMRVVFLVLADHHNSKTGQCNPSLQRIVIACGLSRASVCSHLKKLKELGFIDWQTGGHSSNAYRFPELEGRPQPFDDPDEKGPLDGDAEEQLSSSAPDDSAAFLSSSRPDDSVIEDADAMVWQAGPLSSSAPDANKREHKGPSRHRPVRLTSVGTSGQFRDITETDRDQPAASKALSNGDAIGEVREEARTLTAAALLNGDAGDEAEDGAKKEPHHPPTSLSESRSERLSPSVEGPTPNVIALPANHRVRLLNAPPEFEIRNGQVRAVAQPEPILEPARECAPETAEMTEADWDRYFTAHYGAEAVHELFRQHRDQEPDPNEVWR
ncbi:helix-turn-helix domain-containing protein [Antarctobacter heliothermus]|uniref:Helix-turn-helix domain-containing protein n=1 Tax=Antarctobacter heliothermus TaxID=74033 RepID=A0A239GPJ1_9RHOB|nr:Helix-turn-helix domain-containing protein [Antarctobacter heliothermus]